MTQCNDLVDSQVMIPQEPSICNNCFIKNKLSINHTPWSINLNSNKKDLSYNSASTFKQSMV